MYKYLFITLRYNEFWGDSIPTNKTIAISQKTKDRLLFAKIHPRETFDDLINRLLDDHDKK